MGKCKSLGSLKLLLLCDFSYMGPVSCAFSSWAPEGALLGSGCSSWLLDSTHYISILSFPEAYCRGQLSCDGLMAEIFFTYWYQFSSVSQSCPTLCKPMDSSMPGLPIHHQLQEFTRTHIHWVSDVIQPSHPLLSPSPPTFNLSEHQGLFKWVSSSH